MPGPISQSHNPFSDSLRKSWKEELKAGKTKFFVLKAEDFLNSISEEDCKLFNYLLQKHERYRVQKGKSCFNRYWIVNRDEPWAYLVKKIIEENIKGSLD